MPQIYFELNINGGPNGILNAFTDLCTTKPLPIVDATFTGQNGKTSSSKRQDRDRRLHLGLGSGVALRPCAEAAQRRGRRAGRPARSRRHTCRGRLTIQTASAVKTSAKRKKITLGSRRFAVKPGKSQTVKVKVTKTGKKVVKRYKRLRVRVAAKLDGARTTRRTVKLSR